MTPTPPKRNRTGRPAHPLVEPFIAALDQFAAAYLVSCSTVPHRQLKNLDRAARQQRAALIERYRRALKGAKR